MVWKPKQRELSKEEAVELAKSELHSRWLGSPPLVAAWRAPGSSKFKIYPLDPDFAKKSWMLVFLDPFSISGSSAFLFLKEWSQRYRDMGLGFLGILNSRAPISGEIRSHAQLAKKIQGSFALVHDTEGGFGEAFGVAAKGVATILYSHGKILFRNDSEAGDLPWFQEIELQIQKFLRKEDPGLPLLPVATPAQPLMIEVQSFGFGEGRALPSAVRTQGKFSSQPDCIVSSEANSTLSVKMRASSISIVAKTLAKGTLHSKVMVEIDGKPVYDAFSDKDLQFDESGYTYVSVPEIGLYQILKGLPGDAEHEASFMFMNADVAPMALYRILIGN